MYTIGQVSEMFNLPVSTLRYYDKEGLFPFMQRASGIRQFSDTEIAALKLIECLKKSGLEIRNIKQFMEWCQEGSRTYELRKQLFERQKAAVEKEMEKCRKLLICLLSSASITSRLSRTATRTEYIQCFQTSSPPIFRLPTTTHTNNYYLLIIFNTKYGG